MIERSTVGSGLVTNGLSKTRQAEGGDRKGGSRSARRSGQGCNPWRAHQSSANLLYSQRTQGCGDGKAANQCPRDRGSKAAMLQLLGTGTHADMTQKMEKVLTQTHTLMLINT